MPILWEHITGTVTPSKTRQNISDCTAPHWDWFPLLSLGYNLPLDWFILLEHRSWHSHPVCKPDLAKRANLKLYRVQTNMLCGSNHGWIADNSAPLSEVNWVLVRRQALIEMDVTASPGFNMQGRIGWNSIGKFTGLDKPWMKVWLYCWLFCLSVASTVIDLYTAISTFFLFWSLCVHFLPF